MAEHGFYNANEFRDYPFIYQGYRPDDGDSLADSGESLPRGVVLDFRCLFGPSAGFIRSDDDYRHVVYLYSIARTATEYVFEFRNNVPAADNHALIFSCPLATEAWTTLFGTAEDVTTPASSDAFACTPAWLWEGVLVVGELALLALAEDETRIFSPLEWQAEPALIQTSSFLQYVSLANDSRTIAYSDCDTSDFDPPRTVLPYAQCLTGPLLLREGYNCSIRQDDTSNTIVISGVVGGGAGRACEEVPLTDDETSPDGGKFLSGGPACDEIIATVNGLGGRYIRFVPGPGITIARDPDDPHGLVVTLDLTMFNACLAPPTESSTDSSESSESLGEGA